MDFSGFTPLPRYSNLGWVFPGQGAQSVGMGKDLVETYPVARAVFQAADDALGFSISRICFEGPEDELIRTENTQPAIVTHSIAALMVALQTGAVARRPMLVAGHSLGEYAALIAVGALKFEEGIRLVRDRGLLMQEACDREPSTMAAVLGMEPEPLREVCEKTGAYLCNVNAPGNITIGGAIEAVQNASEAAKAAGATRVVPLSVSGAFHTPLMQSAADGMRERLAKVEFEQPMIPVVSNVTGKPIISPDGMAEELAVQITSPVLWLDSVVNMRGAGVNEIFEFGPGKVLTGLVKRIDRMFEVRNIGTAAEAAISERQDD